MSYDITLLNDKDKENQFVINAFRKHSRHSLFLNGYYACYQGFRRVIDMTIALEETAKTDKAVAIADKISAESMRVLTNFMGSITSLQHAYNERKTNSSLSESEILTICFKQFMKQQLAPINKIIAENAPADNCLTACFPMFANKIVAEDKQFFKSLKEIRTTINKFPINPKGFAEEFAHTLSSPASENTRLLASYS